MRRIWMLSALLLSGGLMGLSAMGVREEFSLKMQGIEVLPFKTVLDEADLPSIPKTVTELGSDELVSEIVVAQEDMEAVIKAMPGLARSVVAVPTKQDALDAVRYGEFLVAIVPDGTDVKSAKTALIQNR